MIKAVIYDVDGTLINSEPLHVMAWDKALQKYGSKLSDLPTAFKSSMAGRKPIDIAIDLVEIVGLAITGNELLKTKKKMQLKAVEAGVEEMPGAIHSVKRLHDAGIPLGIGAALGRDYVDLVLSKLGISGMFSVVVTGDQITKGKPDPETYSTVVHELGFKPAECVVFEDAKSGIASAKSAGCYCFAISNPDAQEQDTSQADRVVTSWNEVTVPLIAGLG